ncbi:hypothetical protein JYU34_003103 [Plutella xylostella]|uniref:Multidrug resistance protein homolog 49-like n=1 Tax=Plutella xylostella TaxID=51655 RepID=A0ABQ7QZ69_PLUXY|nr:hypothetical protein JYU34_003103 [Plutella xylostella]
MIDKKKKKNKDSETEEDFEDRISFFQIFRYGKWYELLATVVGVVFGMASGFGICFNLVTFGEITTALVCRTTYYEVTSSRLPVLEYFGGGRQLTNASYEENMAALIEDGEALLLSMVFSIGLSWVLVILAVWLVNWSALKQITRIRSMFLRSVLRQDMYWYDTDTSFNLASRMSDDMLKLKDGLGEKLAIVANLVGTAVLCIAAAFPQGWQLTLACASVVPCSIAASVALANYQTKSSVRELNSYSQAGKQAEEVLKSVRTIIAFGGEQKETDRYRRLLEPAESYSRKRGLYTGIGTGLNWVLTYSLNAIGLAYGTRLVLDDMVKPAEERRYEVGSIISIMFSMYMATQSITFCVPHGETFSAARAAAAGIFKLIERAPVLDSQEGGQCPRRVKGEIVLEDVTFNYPSRPEVKILKGFSIHIKPGEKVALVGSSGCGKSTILQLVQRLYDPLSGVVKLDGKNIKNLNLAWLRSSLGVVGQEPVLFRGTIYENIAIGEPGASMEEVQRVAELAYAHEFIVKLPNGYNTMIGERGASLSGGQAQRVAIARALLREPAVLLLDEATSALDPASERRVQAALDRASHTRTTLTVSHRLSTIINADRIICMDQGVIVEQGTHEDLMNLKGFYWKLVTTGKEVKEPEVIGTVEEEINENEESLSAIPSRTDSKRRSRRVHRRPSTRKDSHDWMSPRASISSVMSVGFQNFGFEAEEENEPEEEDDVIPVSNWDLMKQNAPEWPLLVIGSIAAFIQGTTFPVFAVLFGFSMGMFALPDHNEIIRLSEVYSGLFIVVAAIAGISMCLQSIAFTNAGLKMTTRLRLQYFSSLLKQEMGYYDKASNAVGALCAKLSGDIAEIQGATGLRTGLILQGFSSVFVGFVMSMCYNWKMTLVGTAFLPIMVGSIWLEGIVSLKSQQDERATMESATAVASEAVTSIRTVQSLSIEKVFIDKFEESLKSAAKSISQKSRWRGLVLGSGIYVPFVAYICTTMYGVNLVAKENLEYKIVLLVNEAIMYGAYMLGQSLVYAPSFNSAKTCGARILGTIQRVPKVRDADGVKDKKDWAASGNFSIKKLEFSYPSRPHQSILRGIDLDVDAGKTIALVGSSGCGKSTILQLLQRYYDPDCGTILDGRDIHSSLTLPRLRRQLGVVQQQPVLLERSLADNIAYGDNSRKVSMHEVVAAAKQANIHKFIVSLPKGYNTNLGSGGAQLSGGQKQRICIARALIRQPRLLLLDEATSALDAGSEKAVSEALEAAAKGRTCITIAHRLSTIRNADLICVVDKGKIVERGTHDELITLQGHYWRMSKGQEISS